jgi:hypothetical protein
MSQVIEALVRARLEERDQRQTQRDGVVHDEVLGWLDLPDPVEVAIPLVFAAWCEMKSLRSLPALPASVALFVLEHAVDIAEVAPVVKEISDAHLARGFADPTATWPVPVAMNSAAKIEPPRSWPKALKQRFPELPFDVQTYLAPHEAQRDRVVRRAQNEAAEARKQLAQAQQTTAANQAKRDHESEDSH